MREELAEASGTRASPERIPAETQGEGQPEQALLVPRLDDETPRVVIKADLMPALCVLALVSLVGLPVGWLWSRLAPPQESMLFANGEASVLLTVESFHRFDALAIFLLLSGAAGVLTAAALWMVRGRRGPVVLLAGALGSVGAAWLALRVGTSFAADLYPMPPASDPGDVVTVAPEVTDRWAVLAQPLAVSLVYGLAASSNGFDDLGRREPG